MDCIYLDNNATTPVLPAVWEAMRPLLTDHFGNPALFGLAGDPAGGVIISLIEHPSVAEPVQQLARLGFAVDHLPVDAAGVVRAEVLPTLLRPGTRLVSVMLANHETGAVQPVPALAA